MSIFDVPMTALSIHDLAASGLLPDEIAARAGVSEADVLAVLSGPILGQAHQARAELALYRRAVGGTTWTERIVDGSPMRVEAELLPDPAAAKSVLAVTDPARWGQDTTPVVKVVINVAAALPEGYVRSPEDAARIARVQRPALEHEGGASTAGPGPT